MRQSSARTIFSINKQRGLVSTQTTSRDQSDKELLRAIKVFEIVWRLFSTNLSVESTQVLRPYSVSGDGNDWLWSDCFPCVGQTGDCEVTAFPVLDRLVIVKWLLSLCWTDWWLWSDCFPCVGQTGDCEVAAFPVLDRLVIVKWLLSLCWTDWWSWSDCFPCVGQTGDCEVAAFPVLDRLVIVKWLLSLCVKWLLSLCSTYWWLWSGCFLSVCQTGDWEVTAFPVFDRMVIEKWLLSLCLTEWWLRSDCFPCVWQTGDWEVTAFPVFDRLVIEKWLLSLCLTDWWLRSDCFPCVWQTGDWEVTAFPVFPCYAHTLPCLYVSDWEETTVPVTHVCQTGDWEVTAVPGPCVCQTGDWEVTAFRVWQAGDGTAWHLHWGARHRNWETQPDGEGGRRCRPPGHEDHQARLWPQQHPQPRKGVLLRSPWPHPCSPVGQVVALSWKDGFRNQQTGWQQIGIAVRDYLCKWNMMCHDRQSNEQDGFLCVPKSDAVSHNNSSELTLTYKAVTK